MLRPWRPALRLSLFAAFGRGISSSPRGPVGRIALTGQVNHCSAETARHWREVRQPEVAQPSREEGRDRQIRGSARIEAALLQARIEQQRPFPQFGGIVGVLRERVQRRRFALHLETRTPSPASARVSSRACQSNSSTASAMRSQRAPHPSKDASSRAGSRRPAWKLSPDCNAVTITSAGLNSSGSIA